MKKFLVALAAVSLLFSVSISAQPRGGEENNWRERVNQEKKEFLQKELGLADNDPFWTAYDKAQEEAAELMKARFEAHKALREALKDKKGEAELKPLLDAFVKADEACIKQKEESAKNFRSFLSVENQAKLIFAEEKFMRHQMNNRGPQGGPGGGHRPGGHGGRPGPGGHGHGHMHGGPQGAPSGFPGQGFEAAE